MVSLLLPLVAALVPILTLPRILFYFDVTPKVAVLLIAAAVAACFARTNAAALGEFTRTREGRRLTVVFAALAFAAIVSTAASTNPALSLSGGNWRRFGLVTELALLAFILLATAGIAARPAALRTTLRVVAMSGALVALYAVLQYFGWDPLLPPAAYHVGEGFWTIVRPPGTIGHANYLGTYLVFVVFLAGSLLWSEPSRLWKFAGGAAAVIGAFAIVLTGARSAILGAAAGAIFLAVRRRPRPRVLLFGAVAFTVALGGFYYSPWGQKLRSRTRWYREDPVGGARLLLWRDSLRMATAQPLSGRGPETFATEFPRFQSLELARAYPDFYHESPHNIFLDELTGKGILGLIPFLAFTGLAGWATLGPRCRDAPFLAAAFLAALVSLQFNAFVLTTALFFYLTGALLIAGRADPAGERIESSSRRPAAVAAVLGLPLAVLFVVYAIRLCAADVALQRVRGLVDAGDAIGASNAYASAIRWQPPGVSSDLYYSRAMSTIVRRQRDLMAAVKAWQEAVQAGIRATAKAEDRHNAFYNLATLHGMVNNPVDAERSLRGAIEAAPNWYKPRWTLAQVLKVRGQLEEARQQARAALERGGDKHPEVVETLRDLHDK
ncbi:MAG: O-antigen ligase family protein [Bryobacteraceae bacterium]|nr:O-antigen ligase family protein [Bryobacteraceae bacterium]